MLPNFRANNFYLTLAAPDETEAESSGFFSTFAPHGAICLDLALL
jgi:hypothetical protein